MKGEGQDSGNDRSNNASESSGGGGGRGASSSAGRSSSNRNNSAGRGGRGRGRARRSPKKHSKNDGSASTREESSSAKPPHTPREGGGRGRGHGRGQHSKNKSGRGGNYKNKKHKKQEKGENKTAASPTPGSVDEAGVPVIQTGLEQTMDTRKSTSALPFDATLASSTTTDLYQASTNAASPSAASSASIPTLSLPSPLAFPLKNKGGVPMILTRQAHPPSMEYDAQHIAERLAAAALQDSEDEEEEKKEPHGSNAFLEQAHPDSACGRMLEGNSKEATSCVIPTTSTTTTTTSEPPVEDEKDTTVQDVATEAAAAATPQEITTAAAGGEPSPTTSTPSKPREKKKRKKKKKTASPVPPPIVEEEPQVTATDALKALPAQQVSITATSLVKVKRVDSTSSLPKLDAPVQTRKKGKSRKTKGLGADDAANQKAARAFNRAVRSCVERSDPDAMHDILRDKQNHNFALDKTVLETVMKAYVVAAMFDDALYCLRNCTLPGTLSTAQTERILICLPQNLRNSSAYTAADMINALCIATEFDKPTSRTYFMRIVRGIALEFLEEATSARDRICSAPCERLVRSALCVVDASLKRGKKPTDLVVEPGNQLGVFVPDTLENRGIQAGDAVSILPYAGPYPMSAESLDRNMIEATVTNTQPMVLRLQDKSNANLYAMLTEQVKGNVYRIDKLANRMGFNRQLAAAVAIASPIEEDHHRMDSRRPTRELIKSISAMDENIDRVMQMSSGPFQGELTSTAALCAQAVPWSARDDTDDGVDEDSIRDSANLALEKYGALEGLNASQRLAVQGASCNRLTLVQGPPGTGKTAVAIRILQHWARLAGSEATNGQSPAPILATSDSNIAVDNLVEGCANAGLRVVRLGRPEAIRPELLRYCIDRPQSSNGNNGNNGSSYGGGSALAFKEKMKNLKNAQVVCCTCIGSGGDILDNMQFERVLVDEATQATEPAVLVPLTRGCRQLVLVGDHCQLPPTVLSTRAEEEGLGVPLFSRMVACGVPPFMLDTQYRMHPGIAMFPSDLFYGGKLRNGVSPPERRPLAGFPWPREEFPVAFVPVNEGIEMDDGVSKLNEAEAAAACDAVAALLAGGQCGVSDIAVVTPYAAQARLIRRMTRQLNRNAGPPYVEVSSTDGFQGREKEAVVFSAVRSNGYGTVGFVSDWRRVNVSFTRARRALIVIGNDQTLRRGDPDTWMPWLAWADAHGLNMDKPGIPRGRYEPEQLRRVRGGTTAAEMLKDVLARQQAQLKTAEQQLEKAEKNAAGHIIGSAGDEDGVGSGVGGDNGGSGTNTPKTLEEDLKLLSNDGCWDDSDDELVEFDHLSHSVSQKTLTTVSSSNDIRSPASDDDDDGPSDAWDL